MSNILDSINEPNDIKKIDESEYCDLAKEIRQFLINSISKTGGHLASNLGVVELTMALHLSLDLPKDKIIWDVGHQSYVHKLLTGRKEEFSTLRQYGGMSGFPKRSESECDSFDTGHSSTSISVALGMTKARDLLNADNKVVAVIGDGALSGGMAYEALNNAGRLKSNMIIVLNDNHMSISENVGGMANYLGKIRTNIAYNNFKGEVQSQLNRIPVLGENIINKLKKSKDSIKRLFIPGMLFEDMGITYIGPIDGHNIKELMKAFESAKKANKAVLVHVVTKKGRGYKRAEADPARFHGTEPFSIKTGKNLKEKTHSTYTDVFGTTLVELAKKRPEIVAITAAMPQGTGLTKFQKEYPERFFDVGIAEEHGVTFAAGLASSGFHPVVAIYSSFLQRAYDQILHDVCINNYTVTFAVDRAGIVGPDGETHQGMFDISYLSSIPNMCVMAPKNSKELRDMLDFATAYQGPTAIRYPRGAAYEGLLEYDAPIEYGKSEVLVKNQDVLLLAVGTMVETAMEVRQHLEELDICCSVVNMRFIKPIDTTVIDELISTHHLIVTLEENTIHGGLGETVSNYLSSIKKKDLKQVTIALPDAFIEHGDVRTLKIKYHLDAESITKKIVKNLI